MSRTTGSFETLIRGVSEQVPHDRLPGQNWQQDNMLSDPVRVLARRRGSVMRKELLLAGTTLSAATVEDAGRYKEASFFLEGVEYSLAYRPGTKPVGSTMPACLLYNKVTSDLLLANVGVGDTLAQTVLESGISSVTTVGRFILLAAKSSPTTFTATDRLAATANDAIVWIKGGAYSRTFKITVFPTVGAPIVAEYTTMSSYYDGVLDFSDIATSDPDYQKKVNDRQAAYSTAVNQHIAEAAADIQPQNIAEDLRLALVAAGVTTVTRYGSNLHITGYPTVTVDDGGDGFLAKAVAQTVETSADLSTQHLVGKVVQVVPRSGSSNESYYVQAFPAGEGLTGVQEVIWKEAAGLLVQPGFVFLIGAVVSGVLYLASSPTLLASLSGISDVPGFEPSAAGDADSSPTPAFLGKTISYLRTFQDRLMIIAGATVFLSRSGDYFNFFRASALTLLGSDPIEVFAQGSDGDVITEGVQLDRNLILFGQRQQYAVPGREAMTPQNAYIAIQSAHEDATSAPPVANGNLIFFTQAREQRLTLQQMQTGAYADSFDTFDMSTQLSGYLAGTPLQIVALTSPSMVFLRTREQPNSLHLYQYLDSPQLERLYDAWSRWTWDSSLGTLVAIAAKESGLVAITLRQGEAGVYLVADEFSRDARLDTSPYLDSRRPYLLGGTVQAGWVGEDTTAVAFNDNAGDFKLLGRPVAEAATLFAAVPGQEANAEVGTLFDSYVEPTSPYMRDRNDRAILDAHLTLTKYNVTVSDSAAMIASVGDAEGAGYAEVVNWVYRPSGIWVLNSQQVASTAYVTVPVMREIREFRLRLAARNWLPLTISSIEWSGQFFSTRRR